jgi:hypothetical protein
MIVVFEPELGFKYQGHEYYVGIEDMLQTVTTSRGGSRQVSFIKRDLSCCDAARPAGFRLFADYQ